MGWKRRRTMSLQHWSPSSEPTSPLQRQRQRLARAETLLARRLSTNRLAHYAPYAKQREFHRLGKTFNERLFMAGNQLGKTIAGGAEWAMHLTGRYPTWWEGQTFDKSVILWATGVTGESTRDNPQRILIGNPPKEEEWGTGMIPKDALVDYDRAVGTPNLLDNYVVKYGGGGDVQQRESICVQMLARASNHAIGACFGPISNKKHKLKGVQNYRQIVQDNDTRRGQT